MGLCGYCCFAGLKHKLVMGTRPYVLVSKCRYGWTFDSEAVSEFSLWIVIGYKSTERHTHKFDNKIVIKDQMKWKTRSEKIDVDWPVLCRNDDTAPS